MRSAILRQKQKSEPILAKGESKSLVIKIIYQSEDKLTTLTG